MRRLTRDDLDALGAAAEPLRRWMHDAEMCPHDGVWVDYSGFVQVRLGVCGALSPSEVAVRAGRATVLMARAAMVQSPEDVLAEVSRARRAQS